MADIEGNLEQKDALSHELDELEERATELDRRRTSNINSIRYIYWNINTVEPHLSGSHLSGLFTYSDISLRTNPHSSTECASLIRKFSYPDSQSGNRGFRISEARLYNITILFHTNCHSIYPNFWPLGLFQLPLWQFVLNDLNSLWNI